MRPFALPRDAVLTRFIVEIIVLDIAAVAGAGVFAGTTGDVATQNGCSTCSTPMRRETPI